jgi:hypothetical protein
VLNYEKKFHASATEFIRGFKSHTLATVFLREDYLKLFPSPTSLDLEPLSYRGSTGPIIPLSQRNTAASTKHAEHIRAMASQEPYTMPADIPQMSCTPKTKTGTISYASAAGGSHKSPIPAPRGHSKPQIASIAKQVFLRETQQLPTVTDEATEMGIREHVDSQIDTLQTTMAEQLAGPLISTVKSVVNDELLSNNAYTSALKDHFSAFDHSKFALIPAAWKPEIDIQIE